ncbi:hypothetical protein FHR33_000750 [Nonomuraea dietziae]|uniref:Uncharacterized protein n=1 Tax=Nonomuraea dietziae TaxID=65515 RepID=A0A7W5V4T0_9ACTN|nr:hypothetical protein [Nonomuraea dietziae]
MSTTRRPRRTSRGSGGTAGRPVGEGIGPIVARVDAPPSEPVSAFVLGKRIGLGDPSFDGRAAARLHDPTQKLVT